MKYLTTLCFILTLIFFNPVVFGQKLPWREGEKQVKISYSSSWSAERIYEVIQTGNAQGLSINFEGGNGFIRCYVTNTEYNYLVNKALDPQIEIDDLNTFSKSFGIRGVPPGYYTVGQLNEIADSLATHFPSICSKSLIGYSSFNDPVYALKISDNAAIDENEPELIFEGGIHGDEIGGPENCIRFARDLVLGYGVNSDITYAVENAETWVVYCINPYGRNYMTRYNANGVDVNRDGGYMWNAEGNSSGAFSQPETKIIREMVRSHQTVVYISYHSGTEFISYPWSYREDLSPDEPNHNYLAQQYASNSGYAAIPYAPGYTGMYAINGSTKDYGYGATGSLAWSIEISNIKQPPAAQIVPYYLKNKNAMLSMITHAVDQGIHGTIADAETGQPIQASIFINNLFPVNSSKTVGDYHKLLVPGSYSVRVEANGYLPQIFSEVVINADLQTTLNVSMVKAGGYFGNSLVACYIPNNNFSDEGNTPTVIGSPDNTHYSIGRNGYVVIDMGTPVLNRTGNDLKVYENDQTPEGYKVYASNTPDGPWFLLGTGNSTSSFDLSTTILPKAQYIKVVDDGDGTAFIADAGFDLDAVENLHPDTLTVGWINGYVYNNQDPLFIIPDAVISVNGDTCIADANGFFSIATTPGDFEITGSAPNFEDIDTVHISLGDTLIHDMHLKLIDRIKDFFVSEPFSFSPVPAGNQITLTGPEGNYLVEFFSTDGICRFRKKISILSDPCNIETETLRSGLYMVRISDGKLSYTLKVIIFTF
ncbi:MAG: M14 family zinc carboxypeptidase [Chloroflexota bacterium]